MNLIKEEISRIHAVILAAGESKRMGFPKMLLTFNGLSMLENVIHNVLKSCIQDIIIVLGAHKEKLLDRITNMNVTHCFNVSYKEGMLSSVICGVKNLPEDTKAVLIFQGDQPFIKPQVIDLVVAAYLSSGKGIIIPVYAGKRGHPVLIDTKYRKEIEKLDPDKGLRSLAINHNNDVLELETGESGILRDFDTYEDYKLEINKMQ